MSNFQQYEEFEDDGVYALKNGHIAVSPYDWAPGELVFSEQFSGKTYKAYMAAIKQAQDTDDLEGLWKALVAVKPAFNVEGMSAKFDDNDHRLNRWGVAMMLRWVNPFLAGTPWVRDSGIGTQE